MFNIYIYIYIYININLLAYVNDLFLINVLKNSLKNISQSYAYKK